MRKISGWLLFAVGILYLFIAPTVVKILMDGGNTIFGGMSLQIIIAILLIGSGWGLAHPKKEVDK